MSSSAPGPLRGLIRESGTAFRRSWRQLLATDLAYKLLAFALLTPLVGAALRLGIWLSGRPVLADQEILFFALRPGGLLVVIAVASLGLAIVALEQASLMAIGAAAAANARVTALQSLGWAAGRALPVVALALRLVGRTLLLAAPFLAGLGAVYLALLREYDINYYLKERPPVFLLAAGLVLLLVLGLFRVLVPRLVGWMLALPLVLFERVAPRHALAESERRLAGARPVARRVLLLWAAIALLLSSTLAPLLFALGRALAPLGLGNVGLVLPLMLLIVVLWSVVNILVSWFNAAAFALLLTGLFRHLGGSGDGTLRALAADQIYSGSEGIRFSRRRLLAGLAVLGCAAAAIGAWLLLGVRGHDEVVVIAHRGAASAAPENTLAAVEKALEQGADYVEIDVQESADGEVVVAHDSDFMKVAKVPTKVWDATWADLQKIDIGSWFAPEYAGERVPRLRDVLARARGSARVTIELKYYGHDQRLEQRVIDLVTETGTIDDVVVMSLDYDAVQKMRKLRPGWTVGLLAAKAVGDLTLLDADFLAVNTGIATRGFVRRAHVSGKKVYVWTVDDPVRMFQMMNLGVDGIITNRPGLAREVLARRAKLGALERLLVGLAFHFGAAAPDLPGDESGA
jgi:glycerophosphoryl diester phosphodiesterase